ncbi:MAG: response regulator [Desulfobacterales bacterium]
MKDPLLLVDDEPGIRNVLSVFLRDLGYAVHTAGSGEEALRIFESEGHPLVVTDIKMAGMSGMELLRRIKARSPETEVIVVTGHGDMDIAIESLKLDAADFITKPINTDALEISLKRAEEKIALRRQLKTYTENLERMVQDASARLVEAERQSAASQVVEGLFSAIRDIGEDLESGLRYFNDIPCMVSVHNQDLKIVAANPFFRERMGDRIGHDSWSIYTGETATREFCPAAEAFRIGSYHRGVEFVQFDGESLPVVVYTLPVRNRQGQTELVLEIACDLAGTQNLREDLEAARLRYRQLFDEVPCYISVQDRALRLVEINRRFKEDFGDAPGEHCFAIYKQQGNPCTDCPVIRTFSDGESHTHETIVTAKNGSRYNVLITTAPIRNTAGEITHVMEMSTNITEIRRLQSHLESLGLMIGTVSHGIKGMLTGLDGGLYMLDSGIQKQRPGEIVEARDTIRQMARRIKTMVLDILYYAKERDLTRQAVDLREFAGDVALTMENRMREVGISFDNRYEGPPHILSADTGALQSALTNILENAVDACADVPDDRPRNVRFSTRVENDAAVFEIADTGPGMGKEVQEKLFNLFFSTKGNRGTGLGLFISRKIIEQHGGTLEVFSEKGRGAVFTARIPLREESAS